MPKLQSQTPIELLIDKDWAQSAKMYANDDHTGTVVELEWRGGNGEFVRTTKTFRTLVEAVVWLSTRPLLPDPELGKLMKLKSAGNRGKFSSYVERFTEWTREDGLTGSLEKSGHGARVFSADHSTHLEAQFNTDVKAKNWIARVRVPQL
jgi:hypothetical protein